MMISHIGDDDDYIDFDSVMMDDDYINYDSDDSVVDDDDDDDDDDYNNDGDGSFYKRIVDCFNMILYDLANLTLTYYIQTC